MDDATLDRFLAKVDKTASGCWLWTGSLTKPRPLGRGQLWAGGRRQIAARLAYEHWVGPIPDGMRVLHHCDVPSCVNPEHLWVGTLADNARDMYAKGRAASVRGERNPAAVLTEEMAAAIKYGIETGVQAAMKYRVTPQVVSKIRTGKSWSHV